MCELGEGYLAKLTEYRRENPDEVQVVITRVAKHPLSPSWKLLNEFKNNKMSWEEFVERLEIEICDNPEALKTLFEIAKLSLTKNVRLICYEKNPPCHRFVIKNWISQLRESFSSEELEVLASDTNLAMSK